MHERRRRLDYTEPTEKAQADDYGNAVPLRQEVGPVVSEGEAPSNIEMEAFIREKRSEPGYYERHLGIQTQGEK